MHRRDPLPGRGVANKQTACVYLTAEAHRQIGQSNDNPHAALPGTLCCETETRSLGEGETKRRSKIVPHRLILVAGHGVFYVKQRHIQKDA